MSIPRYGSFRAAGVVVVLLTFLAVGPRTASAQDAAATFISNLGHQGIQVLGPSVPAEQRAARFRQLLDSDFDMPEISRFVLGSYARSMSPGAQQQFQPLFREYLV